MIWYKYCFGSAYTPQVQRVKKLHPTTYLSWKATKVQKLPHFSCFLTKRWSVNLEATLALSRCTSKRNSRCPRKGVVFLKGLIKWFNQCKFNLLVRRPLIKKFKRGKLPKVKKIADLGNKGLVLYFQDGSQGLIKPE